MTSISDSRKARGRPPTGISKPIGLRLYRDQEAAIDRFIADSMPGASRPEALRAILVDWLTAKGYLPEPEPAAIEPDDLNAQNDG